MGFTAILGNEMTIPATDVVMYRTGIAAIVLYLYMVFEKPFGIQSKEIWPLFFTGLCYCCHWFLSLRQLVFSTVSVCLAGMATTTFWTSFVEPIFKRRKVAPIEVF